MSKNHAMLMRYFDALSAHFGPCRWWPAQSPFEVVLGVVLTQNTAWGNVEKALERLRQQDALNPRRLWALSDAEIEEAIRPAGYFRVKTLRLRNVLRFLAARSGGDDRLGPPDDCSLGYLRDMDDAALRGALLSIKGIGPESADSIMLYALERPSFVVDAYTWRVLNRHGLAGEESSYDEMRDFFMGALPPSVELYNEYHALIVHAGKNFCRKSKPLCEQCPLGEFLP